jgi:nucleoside-diphosphate-sugar epimerase
MGNLIIAAAVQGKPANLLGPIDLPHEFLFTPDAGPVIASLLAHADGWGEAYNFAGPGSITIRDFAKHCFRATGKPPRFRVVGPHLVRFLGLFSPLLRELSEMSLLLTNPVILDDSKLRRLLGAMRKTPYGEGIRSTIEHLRPR